MTWNITWNRKKEDKVKRTFGIRFAAVVMALLIVFGGLPAAGSRAEAAVAPKTASNFGEYRAYWFAFYDYENFRDHYKNTKANFTKYFRTVVKRGKKLNMNTIIVHVRPCGDAMYPSAYFPWSEFLTGKQGKNPGYDPLKIMVQVAHADGLRIEAWINPYRISLDSTSYSRLSSDNQARIWHNTKGKGRNVLSYGGKLYYNPSKVAVRKLIVNGVKEIVRNYDVDGIHMDDYFYPSFSRWSVSRTFDAKEYKKSVFKRRGYSITTYRRAQVNSLVRQIYSAVKQIDPNVTFGISPAGNPSALASSYAYYVDVNKWLKSNNYIDYITPQIYWGYYNPYCPYRGTLRKWVKMAMRSKVKLYIGIAVYKAGHRVGDSSKERREWRSANILAKEIKYARKYKTVKGFAFFDYSDLVSSTSRKQVLKLKNVLK